MNEKELEALRDEYLSAAEPIRRRIEDLQARLRHARGDEREQLADRIEALNGSLRTLAEVACMVQDSIDGHTKI